jgi:hypothetical protein
VDFRKFERKLKWKEFFSDQDQISDNRRLDTRQFPIEKTNLPPKLSKNLKDFCTGIKSKILGTKFKKVGQIFHQKKQKP